MVADTLCCHGVNVAECLILILFIEKVFAKLFYIEKYKNLKMSKNLKLKTTLYISITILP